MAEEHPIERRVLREPRHTTAYDACGPDDGPAMVFLHGWPELSLVWHSALRHFGALGFRCIAPDMRGYGESSVPANRDDYAVEEIVGDMRALLAGIGRERAIWVGHDWGSPIVWALAGHHPELARAVVSLCVPYFATGFVAETLLPFVDREIYPEDSYPAGQWDYQLFYRTHFAKAAATFEADLSATFRALMRGGDARHVTTPARTARVSRDGGWFDGADRAPDVPRDERVLSADDLARFVAAFGKTGFAGPDAWYVNAERNGPYAARLARAGKLDLPTLFVHAEYDSVCETVRSRLAEPMRRDCSDLTERVLETGHWMTQERPELVNETIETWLAGRPDLA